MRGGVQRFSGDSLLQAIKHMAAPFFGGTVTIWAVVYPCHGLIAEVAADDNGVNLGGVVDLVAVVSGLLSY